MQASERVSAQIEHLGEAPGARESLAAGLEGHRSEGWQAVLLSPHYGARQNSGVAVCAPFLLAVEPGGTRQTHNAVVCRSGSLRNACRSHHA